MSLHLLEQVFPKNNDFLSVKLESRWIRREVHVLDSFAEVAGEVRRDRRARQCLAKAGVLGAWHDDEFASGADVGARADEVPQ